MKTLMSLSALALVVSSLYASPAQKSCSSQSCSQKTYEKSCNKTTQHHKGHKSKIIGAIMHLDLSDAQRAEIQEIFQAQKGQRVSMASAFKDGKFDKEHFIAMKKQKREKKIEQKAELIAAIYDLLTDQQKKELQSKLENKEMKKHCKS